MLLCMRSRTALLTGFALVVMAGCDSQSTVVDSAKEISSGKRVKNSSAGKSAAKNSSSLHVTEEDGKKYLDGIPYDVWFDDPLAVVSNSAAVAPSNTVATSDANTAEPSTDPPMPETKTPAAGGDDWTAYISMDQLQEESKRIRNELKPLLQTPANYTKDFEVVKMHGAVIAALAVITSESGEGVSWKPNAAYIRDYGFLINDSAKGPGKANYDATNAAYENMQSVFNGTVPPDAVEPDAARPASDVASRYYLMKRMKLALDVLKLEINTDAKLKSQAEQALQEAMILTALSKVVAKPDYSSADEEEYQQFIKLMIDKCQEATQAVRDQDYPKFEDALNVIDKTCGECHVQYRNG